VGGDALAALPVARGPVRPALVAPPQPTVDLLLKEEPRAGVGVDFLPVIEAGAVGLLIASPV